MTVATVALVVLLVSACENAQREPTLDERVSQRQAEVQRQRAAFQRRVDSLSRLPEWQDYFGSPEWKATEAKLDSLYQASLR